MMAYVKIARPDHWFKNIFVLPGILLAYFFAPSVVQETGWLRLLAGLFATCLVASSNYVLNEILDAERDKHHPLKHNRPIPSGQVRLGVAYAEWLALAAAGIGLGLWVGPAFAVLAAALWVAGLSYNVPPVRLKDRPYADVISESINNPLRMGLGWYAAGMQEVPPVSVLAAYWMFGAFLMAVKRFAEYRHIDNPAQAARYRQSFAFYNDERLIESIVFYASMFGFLSGLFMARYRIELLCASPLVVLTMAYYMHLGFKPDSPAQRPENLYREPRLMALVALSFGACALLLFLDLPQLEEFFYVTGREKAVP